MNGAARAAAAAFALLLLLLAALPARGQAGVPVALRILSRGTRDGVIGAAVTIDGAPRGETDEAGALSVALPPGRHVVQVQGPGHEPLTHILELARGPAPGEIILRLEPASGRPRFETVVRADPTAASRIALDKDQMTRTPGALGDPFRVIESLPGVTPVFWPLPVYAIRGANPGNTGFFIDGLRVPALFHFALGPAVIHPYFLETLDFYPGGYPARYGRYAAGLVAASTAAPPADRTRGSIDLRLYDAGAILSTPIDSGRGTITAAARYAYPAALLSLVRSDVDVQYWDYQLRADHSLGPGRFTAFAFGSYDSLSSTVRRGGFQPDNADDRVELMFHRLDLRWRGGAGGGVLTAGVGGGVDRAATPFHDNALVGNSKSLIPRLGYTRALGAIADLELGLDGEIASYSTRSKIASDELADFTEPRAATVAGAYAGVTLQLGRLVLTPALRLDGYRQKDARALDLAPRLHVRLRVGEDTFLKIGGGRYSQMPSMPLELPTFEGFGLARYGLQTAWQGAAGIEAPLPGGFALDTSTFVQRSALTDVRDPDLGDPLLNDFLIRREALAYGLELMIRRPPSARLHGWLSYTLARSLRAFEGDVVGASDWDQRHSLNLVVGYRIGRTTLGSRFHLHTGRPVKVRNTVPLEFARLPTFYQLDLRVDRRLVFDRFVLDLYLEVVNSTLTRQVDGLRQTRTGVEKEGFRLVIPSLGVRAEF